MPRASLAVPGEGLRSPVALVALARKVLSKVIPLQVLFLFWKMSNPFSELSDLLSW